MNSGSRGDSLSMKPTALISFSSVVTDWLLVQVNYFTLHMTFFALAIKITIVITRRAKNSFWAQRPEPSCYYNKSSSVGRLAGLLRLHPNKYSDHLLNRTSVTDIARVFFR